MQFVFVKVLYSIGSYFILFDGSVSDRKFDNLANFLDAYFRSNEVSKPSNKRVFYRFAQSYAFLTPLRPVLDINMDICAPYNETCGLNLDVIQSKAMPAACSDFVLAVTYLGQKSKCEDILKLEHTSAGICYTTSGLKKPLTYSRNIDHSIQLSIEYIAPEGFGLDVRCLILCWKKIFMIMRYFSAVCL